jgi:hypothetical protein
MEQKIKSYFRGLETADYQSLIQLFEEDAIVNSPLYGRVLAKDFYKDLFNDTSKSKITMLNMFATIGNPLIGAGHFRYDWIMKNGTYDTFGIRDAFEILK